MSSEKSVALLNEKSCARLGFKVAASLRGLGFGAWIELCDMLRARAARLVVLAFLFPFSLRCQSSVQPPACNRSSCDCRARQPAVSSHYYVSD